MNKLPFLIRVKNSSVLKYDCATECETKVFQLQLQAEETNTNIIGENNGKECTVVNITMTDENDHFPEFENITEAKISENASAGDFVATIRATDKDMDFFGTKGIRYSLVDGSFSKSFAIHEESGNLTVKTNDHGFNREKVSSFYITIIARDNNGTGNRNTLLFKIILLDANDQAPTFVLQAYKAYMFENDGKFTENLILLATDLDEENTNNSRVNYKLTDRHNSNHFTLCETSSNEEGVLMKPVQEIDFEDQNLPEPQCGDSMSVCTRLFELEVMAYDLGIPQQSSTVNVTIELRDENDNGPKFKKETCSKTVTVNETAGEGTKIFKVEAHDADISPAYKKVFYVIAEGAENNFMIDRDEGNITVAGNANLDPDYNCTETHCNKRLKHVLKIEATDSLMKKEDGESCEITVNIKDINNKPPKFRLKERSFEVTENKNNAPITKLTAYDFDSNNKLKYQIDFNSSKAYMPNFRPIDVEVYNYKKLFYLEEETGELRVQGMLDRERMKRIEMFLIVEDENAEVRPQTDQDRIEIVVCDVNDNNPYFVNNDTEEGYLAFVWEESPKNQTLKNIVAKDDDEDNEITYSLDGNNSTIQELFILGEKSGDLTIIKKVDYEEYHWLNFTVTATDSGKPNRSSVTLVSLEIGDVNDNDPVFVNEPYKVEIEEEGENHSIILTVKATDNDSNTFGMYGLVNYRLQRGVIYTEFSVGKENGSIMNTERLDREKQEKYEFAVEAFDTPDDLTKSRKAITQVIVTLLDINDNDPVFEVWDEDCVTIPEDKEVGSKVAQVQATDSDSGDNGTVQYFFNTDEEVQTFFQIDNATGVIIVRRSLLKNHKKFNVSVRAQDKGSPPRNKNETFCISVEDVNLNYPKFVKPKETETVYVQEEETPGYSVTKVMARDEDSELSDNSIIEYKICSICEDGEINLKTFSINENTGEIIVKVSLKKSERPEYLLTIKACDKGNPPKCTEDEKGSDHMHAKIKVIVRNKDDTLPQFRSRTGVVTFEEETLEGKVLIPEAKYQEEFMGNVTNRTICYFIIG
ncbi:cadherin-23-like [Limulus polyphemus]|uniref:Cadherin-23-like n=1 Tax=Limulus polyphemus TaxID=6850 RepID=A0ABM1TLN4_LIMPO|nr:cadherin-23-like [Limulus polyphemus]